MRNSHRIESLVNSSFFPLVLFFLSFVFVSLFSRSTSFLYVYEGFDPAIFKQMGLALLKGKTLYVDYFDNKGCILYFIQALGLFFGGNFVLMLLQAVALTFTLVIWDKIIAFNHDGHSRLACLVIALFLLLCFYDGGDLSEEWCMPFASYPILLYFKQLNTHEKIKKINYFAIGICFGIISFIRINNASAFLGFILYLFLTCLIKKDYKNFITNMLMFFLGFALIASLCILYFYLKAGKHGVEAMLYGTFFSYFEYFNYQIHQTVYHYVFYILFLTICIVIFCINNYKQKDILLPVLFSYAIFILSSGKRCFNHYLIAVLPLIVVNLMTIDFAKHRKINLVFALLTLLPLSSYLITPMGYLVNDLILGKEPFKMTYGEFHRCIEEIPELERDSIYNYNLSGFGAGMMQHEGLLQCNRVLFTPLAFNLPTLFEEETSKPFNPPKWIMISWNMKVKRNDGLFIIGNYDLKYTFKHNRIHLIKPRKDKTFKINLYRRKDPIPTQ